MKIPRDSFIYGGVMFSNFYSNLMMCHMIEKWRKQFCWKCLTPPHKTSLFCYFFGCSYKILDVVFSIFQIMSNNDTLFNNAIAAIHIISVTRFLLHLFYMRRGDSSVTKETILLLMLCFLFSILFLYL